MDTLMTYIVLGFIFNATINFTVTSKETGRYDHFMTILCRIFWPAAIVAYIVQSIVEGD